MTSANEPAVRLKPLPVKFYETERGRLLAELKQKMGWPLDRYYGGDFVWRGGRWEYVDREPSRVNESAETPRSGAQEVSAS